MKCEYCDINGDPFGPCDGEARTRRAMTAYHFEGEANSPEDPNRDFIACDAHYSEYKAHWNEMWAEYYAGIM